MLSPRVGRNALRPPLRSLASRHAFTDYRELIAHPDVDAVSVVTAPNLHYEMTKAALEAGKHVMCEKPFTTNAAEAEELLAMANERGLTHMIAHEFRYAPERAYARQLIDEGQIGDPRHISASLHLRFARRPGATPAAPSVGSGGMLGGLGSHFIDGMRHWFGDVSRVRGDLHGNVPDGFSLADTNNAFGVHLDFANGAWGMLTCSLNSPLGTGRVGSDLRHGRLDSPEPDRVPTLRRRALSASDGSAMILANCARFPYLKNCTHSTMIVIIDCLRSGWRFRTS